MVSSRDREMKNVKHAMENAELDVGEHCAKTAKTQRAQRKNAVRSCFALLASLRPLRGVCHPRVLGLFLYCGVIFLASSCPPVVAGELRAGAAAVVISPAQGTPMAGYYSA